MSTEARAQQLQPAQPSVRTQVGKIVTALLEARPQATRTTWIKHLAEACKEARHIAKEVPPDSPGIIAFIAATAAPEQVNNREGWLTQRAKEADEAAECAQSLAASLSPAREEEEERPRRHPRPFCSHCGASAEIGCDCAKPTPKRAHKVHECVEQSESDENTDKEAEEEGELHSTSRTMESQSRRYPATWVTRQTTRHYIDTTPFQNEARSQIRRTTLLITGRQKLSGRI